MGHLISIDTAIKLTKDLKYNSKQVTFTHGAFDLFHAGHSLFLNLSKKEGDILIVGLEPDSNVTKYKGKLRPIINQQQRVEIVVNHVAVDFVFFVDELKNPSQPYYNKLYTTIKPQLITVGKNFGGSANENTKLKHSKVKQLTAEVNSTTKIISLIANRYSDSK